MTVGADGTTFVPFSGDLSGTPGHLVPERFWEYLNRDDRCPGGWLHDVGLPISATQEIVVTKYLPDGPAQRTITVQAFQRTILTDDPLDPPDWRIERANVGSDHRKFPRPTSDRKPRATTAPADLASPGQCAGSRSTLSSAQGSGHAPGTSRGVSVRQAHDRRGGPLDAVG